MICSRCACASSARSGVTVTPDESASITSSFCLSRMTGVAQRRARQGGDRLVAHVRSADDQPAALVALVADRLHPGVGLRLGGAALRLSDGQARGLGHRGNAASAPIIAGPSNNRRERRQRRITGQSIIVVRR
jgi:hypothetical protein